jgi:hypothetical protein
MLGRETADLVHQSRSVGDEALTDAMHRLQRQLIRRLWRHEPHRRTTDSLARRASASLRSLLFDLTWGVANCGEIRRISCPGSDGTLAR